MTTPDLPTVVIPEHRPEDCPRWLTFGSHLTGSTWYAWTTALDPEEERPFFAEIVPCLTAWDEDEDGYNPDDPSHVTWDELRERIRNALATREA